MNDFMHYVLIGIAFGIGFTLPMMAWMFLDKFTSDLNWKFWQWKRKNFK